jgi:CMP-N,N'-diacetyllegionaminic acid synthase
MKTLAIIPMRAGSKGIKDKNVIPFCGKALYEWTVDQALDSSLSQGKNKIIISTDSPEYRDRVNLKYKDKGLVPFLRPDRLAKDKSPSSGVIIHALDQCPGYDTVILLEPTAPIRCAGDIDAALDLYAERHAKAVISVCESHRCHPAISFEIGAKDNRCLIQDTPSPRRQELRPYYHPTGTLYISNVDFYRKRETFMTPDTIGYKVQPWQDYEVDDEWDIGICASLMDLIK